MGWSSIWPYIAHGQSRSLSVGGAGGSGNGDEQRPCLCFDGFAYSAPAATAVTAEGLQNIALSRQTGAM